MNHSRYYLCAVLIVGVVGAVIACEEKPVQITVPAFDRPQDVALVCYDNEERATLPISCCRRSGEPVDAECGVGLPNADLFAFVTQTTIGEVAVVNMRDLSVIDQEVSIPYASFIPVGGQPSDIVAVTDGSKVITANYETGDLSVILVVQDEMSVIDNPSLGPSLSIDLGGPAARIGIVKSPATYADRFLVVTQPTLGQVALVSLDESICGAESPGCVLGTLSLRTDKGEGGAEQDTDSDDLDGGVSDGGPGVQVGDNARPWSIEMSRASPSAFVGILGAPLGHEIVEIDAEVLIAEGLARYDSTPVDLSDAAVVQTIDTGGKEVARLSLEPVIEKWMYGIDNRDGNLFVVNLRENRLETLANGSTSIDVPGRAISIELFHSTEDGDPNPFTFAGTFALVSTTYAGVYAIDVEDENADTLYPYPHSIRSGSDFNTNPPALLEPPEVSFKGDTVSEDDAPNFVYFENDSSLEEEDTDDDTETESESDTGDSDGGDELPECDPTLNPDVYFKPTYDRGFRFPCDNRQSSNESWALLWEGPVGISGAAVIVDDSVEGQVQIRDEVTDFCNLGMKIDLRIDGAKPGEPGSGSSRFEDYLGDILVVTSAPTPADEDADCTFFDETNDAPAVYTIEKMVGPADFIISNRLPVYGETFEYPLPTEECFGQAFSYEIRAYRHWTITGSRTGRLRETGVFDPDTGTCLPDPFWNPRNTQRVIPGVPFSNFHFTFTLLHGENYIDSYGGFVAEPPSEDDTEEDTDPFDPNEDDIALPEKAIVQFETLNGYVPLGRVVGNNITDIEPAPDAYFLLVDQAGTGLFMFDALGGFIPVGQAVH